jgi:hypothetical protein
MQTDIQSRIFLSESLSAVIVTKMAQSKPHDGVHEFVSCMTGAASIRPHEVDSSAGLEAVTSHSHCCSNRVVLLSRLLGRSPTETRLGACPPRGRLVDSPLKVDPGGCVESLQRN